MTDDQCEDLGSFIQVNTKNEFCAGKKNHFPKIWNFRRIKKVKTGKFYFKVKGPSYNYLGYKDTKYNFYLGGTDACSGKEIFMITLFERG